MASWLLVGWQVIIWRDIKPARRDSGQLAKSTAGSCPACLLPSSQLPDSLHHSPPGRMPYPSAGCLICCCSALCLPGWLVERFELALQLPGCPGAHLVFGISSRQIRPKRTVCLCQRFQTADISFQCKTNQSLHNPGRSVKEQLFFFPP